MIAPAAPTAGPPSPGRHVFRSGGRGYAFDPARLALYEVDAPTYDVLRHRERHPTDAELPAWIADRHPAEVLAGVLAELADLEAAEAPLPAAEAPTPPLRLRQISLLLEHGAGTPAEMAPETALAGVRWLLAHRDPRAGEVGVHLVGAPRRVDAFPLDALAEALHAGARASGTRVRITWAVDDPEALTPAQVERLAGLGIVPLLDLSALAERGPLPAEAPAGVAEVARRFGPRLHPRVRLAGPRAKEVAERLRAWGFGGMSVQPAYDAELALVPGAAALRALADELRALARDYLEDVVADRPAFVPDELWDTLRPLQRGRARPAGDPAGRAALALAPDGRLLPGPAFAGCGWVSLGSLEAGVVEEARQAFLATLEHRREKCAGCWARPFCAGGAAEELLGPAGERDDRHCDLVRATAEMAFAVQLGIAERRPDLLPPPPDAPPARVEVGPYTAVAVNA